MGFRASVLLGAGIGVAALSGVALAEPLGIGGSDVKQAPTPTHQWIYGALVPALVQIAAGGNATVQLAQAAKKGVEYSIAGLDLPEWVGRIEVEVDLTAIESGDDDKPEWSIVTVQPLFQQDDKSETYFTQLQLNYGYQFGDTRLWSNVGVGYRRIINNNMLIGLNTFLDYDFEE